LERRTQRELIRRRKGELAALENSSEQPFEVKRPFGTLIAEIAHPYKNAGGGLQKLIRGLADSNSSILVVCEPGSYLLRALELLPGVQTHLSPGVAVDALSSWPQTGPQVDLCLLEVDRASFDMLNIVDAVIPILRAGDGRLLLLWQDRLAMKLRFAITEVMKIITLRGLDFNFEYTLSRTSVFAGKFLNFAATPVGKNRLGYPLKWLSFVSGASLTIAARLAQPFGSRNPLYLTEYCSSLAVEVSVSRPNAVLPGSRVHAPRNRALLSRRPPEVDLYFNTDPEFTNWVVKSGFLHEPLVVIDVGVLGGENARWHLLREYLVVHGFDAVKEAIEELHQVTWDPKWDRTYHWLAIGSEDGIKEFFVDPLQPTQSRLGSAAGLQRRVVQMRSLDSLMTEGIIPHPDFIKVDVEGQEGDVLLGAKQILASGGVLGMEVETNFMTSPTYPSVISMSFMIWLSKAE
jgi:FkbM family methyltransferase